MDDAHRPGIDPHRGEARMGMDYFFLARATDPQHAKAVLKCLDFQPGAAFSATVCAGGGTRSNQVHGQDSVNHLE